MALLRIASQEYGYNPDLKECAAPMCGLYHSARFNRVTAAFKRNPSLANLLLDDELGGVCLNGCPPGERGKNRSRIRGACASL